MLAIQSPLPTSSEDQGSRVLIPTQLTYVTEEQQTTATSLKAAQGKIEAQVYATWMTLSAFEESSAACARDMLASAGDYPNAIRMAEKLILHVEVLFAAIDEIEWQFATMGVKGMLSRVLAPTDN
jgi:hypothetical protein